MSKEDKLYEVDDFWKFNMRVGYIEDAQKVPETRKLIKLTVNFGNERRTIVAGIGDQYTPEDLKGIKSVFVLNLKPKRIRGILSEGMIIVAQDEASGKVYLIKFSDDVPNGARVW